jgi:hypothetical protein
MPLYYFTLMPDDPELNGLTKSEIYSLEMYIHTYITQHTPLSGFFSDWLH